MRMLDRLKGAGGPAREITTIDDYAAVMNQFAFGGIGYGYGNGLSTGVQQTLKGSTTEMAPNTFVGLAQHAYAANGVVFACMLVRMLVFSSVRFRWQTIDNGKPSDMFGTPELQALERPWVGGTTQDMLVRTILDADLAGNAYWFRETSLARLGTQDPGGEMVRLRPDWVDVILGERQLADGRGQIGWRKAGYVYTEGGIQSGNKPVGLLADEVAHFAPIPDPMASYRGMSWITPVLREIQADQAMRLRAVPLTFVNAPPASRTSAATPRTLIADPHRPTSSTRVSLAVRKPCRSSPRPSPVMACFCGGCTRMSSARCQRPMRPKRSSIRTIPTSGRSSSTRCCSATSSPHSGRSSGPTCSAEAM